jgi:thiol-disulfide isomerase/thioredoxin
MKSRYLIAIGLLLPFCAFACAPADDEEQSAARRPATRTETAPIAETAAPAPAPKSTSITTVAQKPKPTAADADGLFKAAEQAIKNRDVDGAFKKTEEALAADPKHRGALLLQAAILQDKAQAAKAPYQALERNELFLKAGALARRLRDAHADLNPREKTLVASCFYNEGCAHALSNNTDKAIASLNEAVDAGFEQLQLFDTDTDLTSLRDKSEFRDVQKRAITLNKTRSRAWAKQLLADQKPYPFTFRRPDAKNNKLVSSSEFKGKVVLVDLWATWCPPCREEVKVLIKLQNAYKSAGLEVVGLNFEGTPIKEARTTVRKFIKDNGINYTCLLGEDKIKEQLPKFTAYPTLVFLDRTGRVRLERLGYHPYEMLEAIVTTLLEEPRTAVAKN